MVITEDTILRDDGWLGLRPCCFQCRHRLPTPKDPPAVQREGSIELDVQWHKVRICDRNPHGMHIRGDTRQCCGLFELDRSRWHSVSMQEHEWRILVRRAGEIGGQMTLEAWV